MGLVKFFLQLIIVLVFGVFRSSHPTNSFIKARKLFRTIAELLRFLLKSLLQVYLLLFELFLAIPPLLLIIPEFFFQLFVCLL